MSLIDKSVRDFLDAGYRNIFCAEGDPEEELFVVVCRGPETAQLRDVATAFGAQMKAQAEGRPLLDAQTTPSPKFKNQIAKALDNVPKEMGCPSCDAAFSYKVWAKANPQTRVVLDMIKAISDVFTSPETLPYIAKILPQFGAVITQADPKLGNRLLETFKALMEHAAPVGPPTP